MDPIKMEAELHFQKADGKPVVSLVLQTANEKDMKTLESMLWGKLDGVDGIRYCRINTICPHTIGGNGNGKYEIVMTVNHNPWTRKDVPSAESP